MQSPTTEFTPESKKKLQSAIGKCRKRKSVSANSLKSAEKKIISIKKELHHIESTLVWHWFFCENQEQKENILNKLFELMYANNPRS